MGGLTGTFARSGRGTELSEDWTPPVKSRAEALGGVVLRRKRRDMVHAKVELNMTTPRAELGTLESEFDRAADATKLRLQAEME